MESLREVDPKFIKYREIRKIDTGFVQARNVAVARDQSLLAVGDESIRFLDSSGNSGNEIRLSSEPMCVAQATDGTLYVGLNDRVEIYQTTGRKLASWESLGDSARITAIVIDGGSVFVANAGGRIVLRYDRNGQVLSRIGQKDPQRDYPGLIIPSAHLDVAPSSPGRVLVSNPGMHRIETHTADGAFLSCWGEPSSNLAGFCGCCNPTDFALLPDGRIVTSEKGIPRVKVYSMHGQFESVVAGPESFVSNSMGLDLAVDREGHVLVLDPTARAIRVFARTGGEAA